MRNKLLLSLALLWSHWVLASAAVPMLTIADSINPGTGEYLISGIEAAEKNQAPYVVVVLDTPGGLLHTTRLIVQKMLSSPVPVVVFVGPQGAHAGSAGALITFAADVAVMAPATNIGAAHPVSAGGGPMDETSDAKITNDTAAFAESIAKARGRNPEAAIQTVKKSSSLTAENALKQGVIDFIAKDIIELQSKLVGFRLRVAKNAIDSLPKEPSPLTPLPPSLRHRVVSFFANPSLAYMILSFGALCLWIELTHPGLFVPGITGVLCLLVSLVSFQLLPISYGALGLILIGFGLIIAELFLPAYGLLGLAGVLSFVFGSLFLIDTPSPGFEIPLKLIFPTAATLALVAAFLAYVLYRSRRVKHRSGLSALVGETGEAMELVNANQGKVLVGGELWNAVSTDSTPIPKGARVQVRSVNRFTLVVTLKE